MVLHGSQNRHYDLQVISGMRNSPRLISVKRRVTGFCEQRKRVRFRINRSKRIRSARTHLKVARKIVNSPGFSGMKRCQAEVSETGEHDEEGNKDLPGIDVELVNVAVVPAYEEVVQQGEGQPEGQCIVSGDVTQNGDFGGELHIR